MIKSYQDLKVYQLSYELAMKVFWVTKNFPKEELYSLTDQIRRSTRSIPSNIVEGWSKRYHENVFKRHLIDAIGSCDETKIWLRFCHDCKYISEDEFMSLSSHYEELSKMLNSLFDSWSTFEK